MRGSADVGPPLRVLLLADDFPGHPSTVLEHIDALVRHSRHEVSHYNPRGVRRSLALDLDAFDVVVIHYSIVTIVDQYLSPAFRDALTRFRGLKVQLIQDEYRWIEQFRETMRRLGISVLFSLIREPELEKIWPTSELPGVAKVPTLAGYVPLGAESLPAPTPQQRPLDVVYRGRELPYWLGRLGQEKLLIGKEFLARAPSRELNCDIDWRESARVTGAAWTELLKSGRATLASESGASIADFDGGLQRAVDDYLLVHPGAGFEEVHAALLTPYEGNAVIHTVSPRIFEAVAVRTALVLFPGDYSGVVEAERHYIPLQKDFSNFDEVADRLRDVEALRALTDRAHEEIVASGRYSILRFVESFDHALDEHGLSRAPRRRHELRLALARVERPFDLAYDRHVSSLLRRARVLARGVLMPWRDPVLADVVPKLALVLGFLARNSDLRRLLRSFARLALERRRVPAPLGLLFADLLRVGLVRQIDSASSSPHGMHVERVLEGDTLVLRTAIRPGSAGTSARTGRWSVDKVVWDHSAAGTAIRPRGTAPVVIGQRGIYRFEALEVIAARDPETVSAAVGLTRSR